MQMKKVLRSARAAIGGMKVEFREMMIRIGVAVLIGTMIGVEREIKNRPAGS